MTATGKHQMLAQGLKATIHCQAQRMKRLLFPITLDRLPYELKMQILASLESPEDLKAAVLASGVLYQIFLMNRKYILGSVLSNTLGDRVFVDAFAVHNSLRLDRSPGLPPEAMIEGLMRRYRERVERPAGLWKECTGEDLVHMASFYSRTIRPVKEILLEDFGLAGQNIIPTPVEMARLDRALYRIQLWCNLYGTVPGAVCPPGHRITDYERVLVQFFGSFQPWEIEEIATLYHVIAKAYEDRFDGATLLIDPSKPGSGLKPNDPPLYRKYRPDCIDPAPERLDAAVGTGLERYSKVRQISQTDTDRLLAFFEADKEGFLRVGDQVQARRNLFWRVLGQSTRAARQILVDHPDEWKEKLRNGKMCWGKEGEPSRAWVNYWYHRYNGRSGLDWGSSLRSVGFVFWDQDGICTPS